MKWLAVVALMPGLAYFDTPDAKPEQQFMEDAKAICRYESSKRGVLNKDSFDYCIEKQNEAYEEIKWANETLGQKEFYSTFIYPYCYQNGTRREASDSSSIAYCIREEIDAFETVAYFAEKYDIQKVMDIATAQMVKFGSWRMAVYELRRAFEPRP